MISLFCEKSSGACDGSTKLKVPLGPSRYLFEDINGMRSVSSNRNEIIALYCGMTWKINTRLNCYNPCQNKLLILTVSMNSFSSFTSAFASSKAICFSSLSAVRCLIFSCSPLITASVEQSIIAVLRMSRVPVRTVEKRGVYCLHELQLFNTFGHFEGTVQKQLFSLYFAVSSRVAI